MAAARLLRMSRPLGFTVETDHVNVSCRRPPRTLMCLNRKTAAGCAVALETKTRKGADLGDVFTNAGRALSRCMNLIVQQRSWGSQVQMLMEKAIIDCRFFTLLAVGGSLLCSVLCFVEGCILVTGSYLQNFHALPDREQMVLLLIEAVDMFIMGTAMVVFATALYVMFVGQNSPVGEEKSFNKKKLPSMESTMDAKSKIGHAVMLILQVQVLDKFRSIAVTNGMDLACFAGAIFLSSASIFILSRISVKSVPVA